MCWCFLSLSRKTQVATLSLCESYSVNNLYVQYKRNLPPVITLPVRNKSVCIITCTMYRHESVFQLVKSLIYFVTCLNLNPFCDLENMDLFCDMWKRESILWPVIPWIQITTSENLDHYNNLYCDQWKYESIFWALYLDLYRVQRQHESMTCTNIDLYCDL